MNKLYINHIFIFDFINFKLFLFPFSFLNIMLYVKFLCVLITNK